MVVTWSALEVDTGEVISPPPPGDSPPPINCRRELSIVTIGRVLRVVTCAPVFPHLLKSGTSSLFFTFYAIGQVRFLCPFKERQIRFTERDKLVFSHFFKERQVRFPYLSQRVRYVFPRLLKNETNRFSSPFKERDNSFFFTF